MSIKIFWSCAEEEWLRCKKPDPVAQNFYQKNLYVDRDPKSSINRCPSFNDNLKNLYCLRSIYDYEFFIENNEVKSKFYSQKFFDDHVLIRSLEHKFFSFTQKTFFFADTDSLLMTAYEYPYLEDNNITERCMIPSAVYDIGKWFRPLEFPFYLKDKFDSFKIEENEVYSYVRFHTSEKIDFQQFVFNEKIESYARDVLSLNNNRTKTMPNLNSFYNKFSIKNNILSEIKKNLL